MTARLDWSPFVEHKNTSRLDFAKEQEKARLNEITAQMRFNVMEMMCNAGYGHPISCLGLSDLFAALFFGGLLHYDAKNPSWDGRDRLVVSNGHISALFYTALSMAGYFPASDLSNYARKNGLPGHPHRDLAKGIELSSGSLGQGVSVAVGMAIALKPLRRDVFLTTSDGEIQEGQVWEAMQAAVKYELSNLNVFLDCNGIQNSGFTKDVMPSGDLEKTFSAMGFDVAVCHNASAFEIAQTVKMKKPADKPFLCLLNTTGGKGVSFMENEPYWHDEIPVGDLKEKALAELAVQKQKASSWKNFLTQMETTS
ncbi:MAG: transketolase [Alphaproteobacteria bacterium]|nr:transketolase [Alphaproteobacteria bacterium]